LYYVSQIDLSADKNTAYILGSDHKMRINKFDGTNWNTQTVGTDLSNLQVKNFALSGDQKKIILTDTNNNLYSGKYNNTINSFDTITKFSSNDI
jgi:hypothetical protein